MFNFLRSHMKLFLTLFGFLCGITPWILILLDKKLTQRQKDQFNEWVAKAVPQIDSLHPNDLFLWAKNHQRSYVWSLRTFAFAVQLCFVLVLNLFTVFYNQKSVSGIARYAVGTVVVLFFFGMPQVSFNYYLPTLQRVFTNDDLSSALRSWRKILCEIIAIILFYLLLLALFCLVFRKAAMPEIKDVLASTDIQPYLVHWWGWVLAIIFVLFEIVLAAICIVLFFYMPLILMALLRFPLKWASDAALWLATHPKGAWAALILAISTGVSLLRLFF